MAIDLPDQLKQERDEIFVTLLLPEDTNLPTVEGQWERDGDNIIASYTRYQLSRAVWAAITIRMGQLEERLKEGEHLIAEAQGSGEQQRAEELGEHYRALMLEMARLHDWSASLFGARNE